MSISDEIETLRPCPACERCATCDGKRTVLCTVCKPSHIDPCAACETCGICKGTHLVSNAERQKWVANNPPPPAAA